MGRDLPAQAGNESKVFTLYAAHPECPMTFFVFLGLKMYQAGSLSGELEHTDPFQWPNSWSRATQAFTAKPMPCLICDQGWGVKAKAQHSAILKTETRRTSLSFTQISPGSLGVRVSTSRCISTLECVSSCVHGGFRPVSSLNPSRALASSKMSWVPCREIHSDGVIFCKRVVPCTAAPFNPVSDIGKNNLEKNEAPLQHFFF